MPLEEEIISEGGIIIGKTILIGGNEEPIYLDEDISFSSDYDDEDLEEFVFGQPIVIGGGTFNERDYFSEESSMDFGEESDDSLYQLDSEFDLDTSENAYSDQQGFSDEYETDGSMNLDDIDADWDKSKHSTLMGKVDNKLLSKIREYRENIQDLSQEKLLGLMSDDDRDKLLLEAAQLGDDTAPQRDINQLISEIDRKLTNMTAKYTELQITNLNREREIMLQQVEREVEALIGEQLEIIKNEAEEHIEETVQYYKKKLENDNQNLSMANNIIARREQILDESYAKSLSIVEEAEEKARQIIENSANAQDEADATIADAERRGEEIREEAEIEAERIISDANLESARIIQAAEDQHQDIVEAATQDGFSVGYQEGKEEAIKENSELLREATNALNKLHAAFPVAVKQNEERLIKISYQIAHSVLGEPASENEELCNKVLNRALREVSDLDSVKVKVNPSDLDILLPKQEYFKAIIPDVHEFTITGDINVAKGGCVINTTSDAVNISINSQLSILEAVFNDALSEYEGEESYQENY